MRTPTTLVCACIVLFFGAPTWASDASAFLFIETSPKIEGARVSVDGDERCVTAKEGSCVVQGLEPGSVSVTVQHPDGRVFQDELTVTSGLYSRVSAEFAPVGYLTIVANVGGADVFIDGQPAGTIREPATAGRFRVGVGDHVVRVEREGYRTDSFRVELRDGQIVEHRFVLEAIPRTSLLDSLDSDIAVWALVVILAVGVGTVSVLAIVVVRQSRSQRVTSRTIDRYELKEQIGRGGMATVFRAVDTSKRRSAQVALKVLDRSYLHDQDMVHKFLREGEILQQIEQRDPEAPVVRVLDFGRAKAQSGRPFLALELVEGENLLSLLSRRGAIPPNEAVPIVAGVARALVPAHASGIYHRDLTPDNVILTRKPRGGQRLRLIDFGVARHEYTSHGTLDGSIAGKPPFMSPEQCRGSAVDGRSDVYSLGILLYTLVHGSPPFTSSNPLEVMRMHQEEEPVFADTIEHGLRQFLETSLQKNPQHRPADAHAFLLDLDSLS